MEVVMLIKPLHKEKLVGVDRPLPPCWIRNCETRLIFEDRISRHLWQVGPGKKIKTRVIEMINETQEVICGASFLFSDLLIAEALLEAAKRGVRIYFLTASEHRVKEAPRTDDFFSEKMCNEHKELLDRLAGKVLLRSAEHLHAKFLLSDPQGIAPRGIMSTANFNLALTENVELGVELSEREVDELAGWFNQVFWLEAEHELLEKGKLSAVTKPPVEPHSPKQNNIVVTAKGELGLQEALLNIVRNAQHSLLVANYGLELGHAVVDAIAEKAQSGIPVTIFTRPRPAVKDAVEQLAKAGAHIVAHDKLHAKVIVGDNDGIVMSANLQRDGLDQGFEVGIKISGRRLADLRQALVDWEKCFPWHYALEALPQEHLGEIWLADKGGKDGKCEVVAELTHKLPVMTGQDALSLGSLPEPELALPEFGNKYPQKVRYQWSVTPPSLPGGAKERKQVVEREQKSKKGNVRKVKKEVSYDPPEHEFNGNVYVVLKPNGDLEKARRRAMEIGAKVVIS
jgi:cardiolipin synthase